MQEYADINFRFTEALHENKYVISRLWHEYKERCLAIYADHLMPYLEEIAEENDLSLDIERFRALSNVEVSNLNTLKMLLKRYYLLSLRSC